MKTLNLINPDDSDLRYERVTFPDSQPHLRLNMIDIHEINLEEPIRILARLSSANDVLLALFAKDTLDYLELTHVELHVSYLLSARTDRVMLEGEPFSLKVIASMLNTAAFRKIKIFDPHSDVSTALIDRSYPVTNHKFVRDAIADYLSKDAISDYCLVSPDAGALKKIHKLAAFLNIQDVVECIKERDLKTGALIRFSTTTQQLNGKTCFIVDDILDGGGTFAGTATMLKQKGAGKIVVVVSHGIFSKGYNIPCVDAIYTTNSFRELEQVHCFSIKKYFEP